MGDANKASWCWRQIVALILYGKMFDSVHLPPFKCQYHDKKSLIETLHAIRVVGLIDIVAMQQVEEGIIKLFKKIEKLEKDLKDKS
jgi:hypothetical protein